MSNSLKAVVIAFALICLGFVLRMSNFEEVQANFFGHLNFYDPDSYYYLRQLEYFLKNFPAILHFDPLLDWPYGMRNPWPEGFLWFLGIPVKLVGLSSGRSMELAVNFLIMFWGIVLCLCYFWLAKLLEISREYRLLLLFLLVCSPAFIRYSCMGQIDHHLLEFFFPALFFGLYLKASQPKNILFCVLLGIAMSFSLLVSSAALFCIGALYVVILFFQKGMGVKDVLAITATCIVSLLPYILWKQTYFSQPFALAFPSYFHISLIAFLGLLVCLWRLGKSGRLLLGGLLLIFFGFAVFSENFALIQALKSAFGYVFGAGIISQVTEAQPLFFRFGELDLSYVFSYFGYLFFLFPAAAWLLWKENRTHWKSFLVYSLILLVPVLFQKRFSHLFSGLYFIILVAGLECFFSVYREKVVRLRAFLLAGFVGLILLPGFHYGFSPSFSAQHRVDFSVLKVFQARLSERDQETVQQDQDTGILAPTNLGHALLYVTKFATVTGPFYPIQGLQLDFQLRSTDDADYFMKILRENKIRYVFITNDFQYFEVLHDILGIKKDYLFFKNSGSQKVFDLNVLDKFVWYRLLQGEMIDGLTDFAGLQIPEKHFYNQVRILRVEPAHETL